ncbi:MAG: inositol monophosphatase, partial [bacterium]|nr:inositol monophosphatase [bacterium]
EKRYMWIFDPLDGAANFQTGIPVWGMSLALFENFWPIFGLFYMPSSRVVFSAHAGGKAYCGNEEIRISTQENIDDESLMLTFSRFHQHYRPAFPGKIRNLGCTAAHICYVATGSAEAAVLSNESHRDLAAACIIMQAAGGKIYKMDGTEFNMGENLAGSKKGEHLLVVSPEIHSQVHRCLETVS